MHDRDWLVALDNGVQRAAIGYVTNLEGTPLHGRPMPVNETVEDYWAIPARRERLAGMGTNIARAASD
jgi:hypothetical protein